jgi:hypothetical protein
MDCLTFLNVLNPPSAGDYFISIRSLTYLWIWIIQLLLLPISIFATYGFRKLSCPDFHTPVPCGDGTCHSDYISCLRVSWLPAYYFLSCRYHMQIFGLNSFQFGILCLHLIWFSPFQLKPPRSPPTKQTQQLVKQNLHNLLRKQLKAILECLIRMKLFSRS